MCMCVYCVCVCVFSNKDNEEVRGGEGQQQVSIVKPGDIILGGSECSQSESFSQ